MPFRTSKSAPKRVADKIKKQVTDNPRTAAAAAAGVVAAAAAGVAAVRRVRTHANGRTLHVMAADGAGWVVARDRGEPLDHFDKKRKAIEAAKELARKERPSRLEIHRLDGKVSRSHTYEVD
jgi:hypothetical protein